MNDTSTVERMDCCIVGAAPAGAVLAPLVARRGIAVTLLGAHADFERDFRGDLLQPAVLDLMGLADRILGVSRARFASVPVQTPSGAAPFHNVRRLKTPYPFITMMPQVRFLTLIVGDAQRCSTVRLVTGARIPFLSHIAARIFGFGVWPVRLDQVPTTPHGGLLPQPAQSDSESREGD